MRNVIRNKEKILEGSRTYSCNVYIKATDENDFSKKKKVNDTIAAQRNPVAGMSMTEVYLKLDYAYPNKIKEERNRG